MCMEHIRSNILLQLLIYFIAIGLGGKKSQVFFFFLSHQCAVHSPVCKIQVFHFDYVCASKLLSAGGSSVQPQASVALFCLYNCKYTVPLHQKCLGTWNPEFSLKNKKICHGTSQEVQWLGLHTSNAEGTGLIAAQGTKILRAVQQGQKYKRLGVSELLMRDCRSVIKVMAYLLFSFNETLVFFFLMLLSGVEVTKLSVKFAY